MHHVKIQEEYDCLSGGGKDGTKTKN
jgi:hypothetical protein